MEEEEFDSKSEIGQLIQNLQKLCKKPQIDHQLSLALDTFQERVTRQEAYLNNGIFNINFAEAAIFLQNCTELYGKKVDLLWDEFLQFHTRLIEYDCQHDQERGKTLDKDVIEKLEERRNRYKRKKKFKLALEQNKTKLFEDFLFEKEPDVMEERNDINNELDQAWKELEYESSLITKIPKAVYKQKLLKYRIKNYYIMKSEDIDIYDPDDGEFNTKYSRIPGWHVIEHIFEYNNKGLLPDKNNVIATLRLSCYLRIQFMKDNNIPFNTPYSQYKDKYLEFKNKFFKEESNKWQNMPLNTIADLRKQFEYLAKMESENNTNETCLDITSPVINTSSNLSSSDSNKKLFVNVEKLPQDILDKTRQDSGYFELDDTESDDSLTENTEDCTQSKDTSLESGENEENSNVIQNNNEQQSDITSTETVMTDGNSNTVNSTEEVDNTNEVTNTEEVDTSKEVTNTEEVDTSKEVTNTEEVDNTKEVTNTEEENNHVFNTGEENINTVNESVEENHVVDNDDVLSIMSDHDYCGLIDQVEVLKENKNVINKAVVEKMVPLKLKSKIIPRIEGIRASKENRPKIALMGPPPLKRRKLSQKQIEKLMKSKIVPVKEMKFEKFFSLNYQPQMGEGEIQEINYESEDDVIDDNDDVRSVISDHNYSQSDIPENPIHTNDDDVCSVVSDHNYCQLLDDTITQNNQNQMSINDSGFLDGSEHLSINTSQELTINSSSNPLLRGLESEDVEEYQRLLTQIEEERRNEGENPEHDFEERERRNKEMLESRARVEEWRETITPILHNLKENDFDIHEYGGKIMEGMEIGESKLFKNVVDGKSSAEVVRYFLASLQLANTYNIEICGAKSGEKSNDTYTVKLLNKDRYHEHLTDYHAPSEDTFQERIKKMRMLKNIEKKTNHKEIEEHRRSIKKTKRRRKISSSDNDDDDDYDPLDDSTPTIPSQNRKYSYRKRSKFNSSSNVPTNSFEGETVLDVSQPMDSVDSSYINGSYSLPPTAECFESELTAKQTDPSIQIYSTPISGHVTRAVETNKLNQRVLFK